MSKNNQQTVTFWDKFQPKNGAKVSRKTILGVMLLWAITGMLILAFVESGPGLVTNVSRLLGWWLSIAMVPLTLIGAYKLSRAEEEVQDLFEDLN